MRWVILGSAGQLGAEFLDLLGNSAIGFSRPLADLSDPEGLERRLLAENPLGVINCAAFNHVDKAEDSPGEAFECNSWGVRNLAAACARRDWKLVHFSTDHVFSGPREAPWLENDTPTPANTYGLSKYCGEKWLREIHANSYVLRTCGLYGSRGKGGKGGNFVSTVQRLAASGNPLRVVNDQFCNPSSARDVAKATIQLVGSFSPGTYHLANSGVCSWHEFAVAVLELAGSSSPVHPISTADFSARARRPQFSALGSRWCGNPGYPEMRHWREALVEHLNFG